MTKKTLPAERISFRESSHSFKVKIVQQIENGFISKNFAAKKYLVRRSTIDYWCKKLGIDMNEQNNHSTQKQLKKLKEKIEELELINRIKQEVIDECFKRFGKDEVKKSYPKQLLDIAKEIEKSK